MLDKAIPFEIHLTTDNLTIERRSDFLDFCAAQKVKPLMIELAKGKYIHQPMISKVLFAHDVEAVLTASEALAMAFVRQQFKVERLKIEVPAENFGLFQGYNPTFQKYFEWHGKIDYTQREHLIELCRKHHVHLSMNALSNQPDKRYITLREYGSKEEFDQRIGQLTEAIQTGKWILFKQESEYCIYDNNNYLDTDWLTY